MDPTDQCGIQSWKPINISILDISINTIPNFFIHFVPSYRAIRDTLSVCKRWYHLKMAIYKKVEEEWPFVRRSQIIHHLFQNRLFFSPVEDNLIIAYKRDVPLLSSAEKFINEWLKHSQLSGNLIKSTCALIGKKFGNNSSPLEFTKYLLDNEEFEAAFAYSENVEEKDRDNVSRYIQQFLIYQRGYQEAFKLTIAYNDPKSQTVAYVAFLQLGINVLNNLNMPYQQTIDLLNHPFIRSLKLADHLPPPAVHVLLEKMIFPLCKQENSFIEENILEIDQQPCFKHLFKNPLIHYLFSIIPNEYDFHENYDHPINEDIKEFYNDAIYSSNIPIPDVEMGKITEEEEESFIEIISAIPHLNLRTTILFDILECFYMNCSAENLNNLKALWSSLHRIEMKFNLQKVKTPQGVNFHDRSTEELMNRLLDNNCDDFINELLKPSTDLKDFPNAVKAVFEYCPGWLNETELPLNNLLNVYTAVFKLFEHKPHIIRLIKDSISDHYIQVQLNLKLNS